MDESDVLKVIGENEEIIAKSLVETVYNSSERGIIAKRIYDVLKTVTPPEEWYKLILFWYKQHPEEFLEIVKEYAAEIKGILETWG